MFCIRWCCVQNRFVACAMCVEKVMHGSNANITRVCFDKLEKYFCMHAMTAVCCNLFCCESQFTAKRQAGVCTSGMAHALLRDS